MNTERIKILEKFLTDEPNDPFNWYALAMEYYEYDVKKSCDLLESLLKNHPLYLPTYYKVAHLLWDLEHFEKAKKIFEDGIHLAKETDDPKALSELKSSHQNLIFEMD